MIDTQKQNLPVMLRKRQDLNSVNDPKNAKEEKQLGVQSLLEIIEEERHDQRFPTESIIKITRSLGAPPGPHF